MADGLSSKNRYDYSNNSIKGSYTILLTSAGGLTGTYLFKHLKQNSQYQIVAIDMTEINPLKKWADAFYKVPAVKDKDYLAVLKEIITKEKIDIIIPVTSYDVDFLSKKSVQQELDGAKMLVMDYEYHSILHNKESCYKYLSSLGINVPLIYREIHEAVLPCILKPRKGSGSKNTIKIQSIEDYEYWSKRVDDYLLVEYIDGKEYTVDCLFDKNGKCLGANVRERVKTNGGGAVITRNDYTQNIEHVIRKLENTRLIKGPINFQFKRLPNQQCCVFDFNTRFASGGLPLTVASGFDIPNMLIQLILNKNVKPWYPEEKNNGLTMIRYYEEMFVYTP